MQKPLIKIICQIASDILYIVVILLILLAISVNFSFFGWRALMVQSGSMTPAIKTGSLIIDQKLASYSVNDVITYTTDEGKSRTTHRIVDIKDEGQGEYYQVKGDANNAPDSALVAKKNVIGKVMLSIPYLGYAASFSKSLAGLILIIIIPSILIIYYEVRKIHHETKKIITKRREKKAADNEGKKNDENI